jgi:predicted glycogen debranching enzyme
MELDFSISREWLETNGLGGFASSTIAGLNTRRYHGLLTAATKPPVGRYVLLSSLQETIIVGDQRYDLSANRYPGVIHPDGYKYLASFALVDSLPTFTYKLPSGITVEKTIFMPHGENTTVIEYRLAGTPNAKLELRPLIAFRDYHSLTHRNESINGELRMDSGSVAIRPYADLPALYFAQNAAAIERTGDWYLNFEYDVERERGLDFHEDLFSPFLAVFELGDAQPATVIASTERRDVAQASLMRASEVRRRSEVTAEVPVDNPLVRKLVAAADLFVVQRGELKTIVAGYHWFSDWGRDTMIALPGIALVTGRYQIARDILQAFANAVDKGMLPNRFPDAGETPEYNTVDATLWFFEAVRAYLAYTGDIEFIREHLYVKLKDIIEWHLAGTRYGIHADADGLLRCGEPGVQPTWMDSKIGDWVVTPRYGKPVEIQALWYNALRIQQELAVRLNDTERATFLDELAALAYESFNRLFWDEQAGCLYDVIDGENRDASIRPNQIFAMSLHYSVLDPAHGAQVVDVVKRQLFTPVGLRSLAPSDPAYRPRYEGGVVSRDSAYHQGTVWPWLMGPFISAYVKVHNDVRQPEEWLQNFAAQLDNGCLGQISEVAAGDAPYTPGGCAAQAWSVAELLRAAVEDVYQMKLATAAAA